MSTLTMPKLKDLGDKITIRFVTDKIIPIYLPPLEVETPRQEVTRLLRQAVNTRGTEYRDHTRSPVNMNDQSEYGCIMGYLLGLKGVTTDSLVRHGLEYYLRRFGWADTESDRIMVTTMIMMNDNQISWGSIEKHIHRAFPVAA